MLHTTLFAIVPVTMSQAWSPTIAIVMLAANVLGSTSRNCCQKKLAHALIGGFTAAQLIGGTCFRAHSRYGCDSRVDSHWCNLVRVIDLKISHKVAN